MKNFEPAAKEVALREYRKLYEKSYRYYLDGNARREASYNDMTRGAGRVCYALGIEPEDLERIEELTRRFVDREEELKFQA